jgi:hypothetical protein
VANYQSSISNKNVFKNISNRLLASIKNEVAEVKDKIEDKLRTSFKNGGCSAYDEFRYTYSGVNKTKPHSYEKWTVRNRDSKNSQSLEIRNRASYIRYLYSSLASAGHDNGYRSAYPHDPVVYTKGGTRIVLTRDEQITKVRWRRCLGPFKTMVTKAIKRGIRNEATRK